MGSAKEKPDRTRGWIVVRGAREHNLRGVNVDIPKGKLVLFTGVSGSGKSSLAVDTLYAEGNRRYVESLSSYARQFLGQMERPGYDTIRGLSPSIAIQQKAPTRNPRSTVGTITEVHDYLRLLFARLGNQHCFRCGRVVRAHTPQEIAQEIQRLPKGTPFLLLSPLAKGGAPEAEKGLEEAQRLGLVRVRLDGSIHVLDENPRPQGDGPHTVEGVVDRLKVKPGMGDRLIDSVETALKLGSGTVVLSLAPEEDRAFSEVLTCHGCGIRFPALTPASFSFNNPLGACSLCTGLGTVQRVDPELLAPDPRKSLRAGAILLFGDEEEKVSGKTFATALLAFAQKRGIDIDRPFGKLEEEERRMIMAGTGEGLAEGEAGFEGVVPFLTRQMEGSRSDSARKVMGRFFREHECPSCKGSRLRVESQHVRVGDRTLVELSRMTIHEASAFFREVTFSGAEAKIAEEILREVRGRLKFLEDVGVGYLTLERRGATLSGGESQRIRLASQLGSDLTGVLYILDEPSVGLHARDIRKLIDTLKEMRDLGNTILVVEHDPEMIRSADHVIDFGPGAGVKGGSIVFKGPPDGLEDAPDSLTGEYLKGRRVIPVPKKRRVPDQGYLTLRKVTHNNLQGIDVRLPLGLFTCITGVSGAGKSTLVNQVLYPAMARSLGRKTLPKPGAFRRLEGARAIEKVVAIDQRPLGRNPRSNPVIYTRAFSPIRELFADLREAKMYGYDASRFSFNVKGGRCESCRGEGIKRIEMHFLPDVYVPCKACEGRRFNDATLKVRFRGLSIADVLDLTVEEALDLFANMPKILRPLATLQEVGLGYVKLGQASTTLSGGESQRVKLARELARQTTGKTLYILDEPTTGLHFDDIRHLLAVLDRLVDQGNTVVVIEHNLDVVKCADAVLDLGPEGGEAGGRVVCTGSPEVVAEHPTSHTGRFLAQVLS
ncbi:MAG: excinuclease ABC subunit UvrA [Planctomycetota bacterium]